MGKLRSFVIIFDNNKDVFQPGEVVSGKVIAEINEGLKARGVRVRFQGYAYVHWTESRTEGSGQNQRTVTDTYSAQETYFDGIVTVWGKEIGDRAGDNPILPPGCHEFPFRFQLGTGLPSSFEGGIGYVRYSIRGIIDRPWRFDKVTKRAFTVLDMYDLNQDPNAMMQFGNQASKTLCCLCCASGPIELQAQIDRGEYCPGEVVVVRGSLENSSNTTVTETSAKIVQVVTFHSTTKSKSVHSILSAAIGPGCGGRMSENIGELLLPIPPAPPSNLRYCNIISISYKIVVTAHIKGPHLNLEVALPLIIGSIPLRSLYGRASQPGSAPTMPGAPDYSGATAPPLYPPPPSYAEATGGAANIRDSQDNDHTMGHLTFAPKYTYYDPQP